jgi:uncharacterized protein YjbI with pentapeptide repeats
MRSPEDIIIDEKKLSNILDENRLWREGQGGRRADLHGADLREADLYGANLREANLDFSCWSLWCGSRDVTVDRRIAAQLTAHFCALNCDDPDYQAARAALLAFAKSSHRAGELGLLDDAADVLAAVAPRPDRAGA